MTNIKNYQLLEDFREQGSAAAERRFTFQERVNDAQQLLDKAKAELDSIISREIETGVEAPKAKPAAYDAVEAAQALLNRAMKEQVKADEVIKASGAITTKDVLETYVSRFIPVAQANELPAIRERMKQGQALILSAMSDFYEKQREYRNVVNDIKELRDSAIFMGAEPYAVGNPLHDHRKQSGFDESEFEQLLNRAMSEMPEGIEYIEKAFNDV